MIRNRVRHRLFFVLMALAIFVSGLVMAFHHHAVEAKEADHCAMCVVGRQARSGDGLSASGFVFGPDFKPEGMVSAAGPAREAPARDLGKRSQAPPAL